MDEPAEIQPEDWQAIGQAEAQQAHYQELDAMVAQEQQQNPQVIDLSVPGSDEEDSDEDIELVEPPPAAAGAGGDEAPDDLPEGTDDLGSSNGVRAILLTLNKYNDTDDAAFLDENVMQEKLAAVGGISYMAWQYEKGEGTGRLHLHAFVQFAKVVTYARMRDTWKPLGSVYLNRVSRGGENTRRVNDYVQKEATRIKGPFITGAIRGDKGQKRQRAGEELCDAILQAQDAKRSWPQFVRQHAGLIGYRSAQAKALWEDMLVARADATKQRRFLGSQALPWQRDLVAYCRGQWERPLWQMGGDKPENPRDDRSIIWIVDKRGNSGKSKVAHFIDSEHARWNEEDGHSGSVVFLEPAKKPDMAHAVRSAFECDTAIFDIPRQRQEGELGVKYMNIFLEGLKNGKVFSPKYASTMLSLGSVIVLVTANYEFEGEMTSDRVKQFTLAIPEEGDKWWAGEDLQDDNDNLAYNRKEASLSPTPWTSQERKQLRLFPLKEGGAAAEGFVL